MLLPTMVCFYPSPQNEIIMVFCNTAFSNSDNIPLQKNLDKKSIQYQKGSL
jgi:hypothetical protein